MSHSLHKIAADIGVPVARRHIFLCCDQSTPKCCEKSRGLEAWDYLKKRLKELKLADIRGQLVDDYLIEVHRLGDEMSR
jgi:hypothetical protein